MTILVTGASGFIGSNLMNYLILSGEDCIGVDNFNDFIYSSDIKRNNIKNIEDYIIEADIFSDKFEDVFKNNKIDIVVHLAAYAGVRKSIQYADKYIVNNLLGTMRVVYLMNKYNCKKLVFASSSSVYGNCDKKQFVETESFLKPISKYAETKLSCEKFLKYCSKSFNMSISCLRFFTVYGPKQRPDLAIHKFTNKMLEGFPLEVYGDGHNVRDYTFISDIVFGIQKAIYYTLKSIVCFEIFNLSGGNPISILDMIKTISNQLKITPKIIFKDMQIGDVEKTISNCNKAKRILGFKQKVSFEEGISKFLEWRLNK